MTPPQRTLAEYWPVFGLRLATPRLILTPLQDDDLVEVLDLILAGIRDAGRMPFAMPWTDAPRAELIPPPVTLIGHVAPAGITLPRSDTWGAEYRNNLFHAEFNTRRIMRVPLEREGASYRGHPQVFASSADSGVHFTDVLEDADGSLLIINTGAWFRRGCPTSIVARADIMGGIYRIRRKGARPLSDPRGNAIDWKGSSPQALVPLLGDARPVVRDRAVADLAKRGDAALTALTAALGNTNYFVRSNAVWALTRIGSPSTQSAARRALLDADARVREAACQSAFTTADREAAEPLVARLGDDSLSVQREAARALGRLGNPAAIPALGGAVAIPRDAFLTHALTYALIEIDAPAETRKLLGNREPRTWRAALIALDRSAKGSLDAGSVFAALRSNNADLRAAALQIAVHHVEWGRAAADYLASALAPGAAAAPAETIARLLAAFLPSPEVREWVRAQSTPAGGALRLDASVLLNAIADSPGTWDESWRELLIAALRSTDTERAQAALRAIGTHRARDFSAALHEMGKDATRPTAFRVAALQLAAGDNNVMDAASFQMLLEPIVTGGLPDARLQGATVLAGAKLTREQLLKLIDVLPSAGPLELQQLLGAFQRGPAEPEIAAKLLAQLKVSPSRWGVLQTTLQTIFQRFPAPAYENAAPMIAEIMNQNVAKDGRVAELENLATGGDAARGRVAFLAGAGACFGCHRVGDTGGTVGSDLSHIGRIRTTRDLVEAIGFPSATIARGYETFQINTKDGRTLVGRIPRESADTVFVLEGDGQEKAVLRSAIARLEPVSTSLMPAGLDRVLEPKALADLVAFLKSLQ